MQSYVICSKCEEVGKKAIFQKSNFRKHLRRLHNEPFQRKKPKDGEICNGCNLQYDRKSVRKHQNVCEKYQELFGPKNKKRKSRAFLRQKNPQSRTFELSPQNTSCHIKEPVKIVYDLIAKGNKIFGSTAPAFNKDHNYRTRCFTNRIDEVSQESSILSVNQADDIQSNPPKPSLTKKNDSYCQICNFDCPLGCMGEHILTDAHKEKVSFSETNLRINELVNLYQKPHKSLKEIIVKSVTSECYCVCNERLQIMASSNSKKLISIASLTKVLNLLVCLKIIDKLGIDFEEICQIPNVSLKSSESTANLCPGQKLSIRNLLKAMILPSGNEAAEAISILIGEKMRVSNGINHQTGKEYYLQLMREYAIQIGLSETQIYDVKGFGRQQNKSTCFDMIKLLKIASENQIAAQIMSQQSCRITLFNKKNLKFNRSYQNTNRISREGYYGKTGHSTDGTFLLLVYKQVVKQKYFFCLASQSESGRFLDAKQLFKNVTKKSKTVEHQGANFQPNSPQGRLTCCLRSIEYSSMERYQNLLSDIRDPQMVMNFLKKCQICSFWVSEEYFECECGAKYHKICKSKEINWSCSCTKITAKHFQYPTEEIPDTFLGDYINKKLLIQSDLDLEVMDGEINKELQFEFKIYFTKKNLSYTRTCLYYRQICQKLDFRTDPFIKIMSRKTKISYKKYMTEQYFPPVRIQKTKEKGFGVVATKRIPKNTLLFEYAGDVLPGSAARINPEYSMSIYEGSQISQSCLITVLQSSSCGPLLNHSSKCSNCKTVRLFDEITNFPIVLLYTSKNVNPGQQLLYNYNGASKLMHYPTESFI